MKLKRNDIFFKSIKLIAVICTYPFFKLKIVGAGNLPLTGAYVLLPKHQRWQDIPFLAIANSRPMYYIAKIELFKNSITSKIFTSLGGLPLNRKQLIQSRNSFNAMIDYLNNGEPVVVFPEGTYYLNSMGRGHAGVIKFIRARMDVQFIPAGINYKKAFFRTTVTVRFGKPTGSSSDSTDIFMQKIMNEISVLSDIKK
jgi:1-acyl-sn-glycerol-3-phosphate acyltransferase